MTNLHETPKIDNLERTKGRNRFKDRSYNPFNVPGKKQDRISTRIANCCKSILKDISTRDRIKASKAEIKRAATKHDVDPDKIERIMYGKRK